VLAHYWPKKESPTHAWFCFRPCGQPIEVEAAFAP
jgi:hypothetical protein